MAELRGHTCWDPGTAAATLNTEAVSPSPAVFFATHAPLRIHRRSADALHVETATRAVDEETVRHDFLNRPTANGVLLMPVVGESGTGKSHLVRWVKEKTPDTGHRHVIYLPKTGTSLKAVVERLLEGAHDATLTRLREEVARTSAEVDQAGLEQRLLNQMQEALAAAEPTTTTERALAGPQGLAVLLLDPHVREHLLQPGRLIPRRAAHLLADRVAGDPDLPLTFTRDDLPLDITDVSKASARARKLLALVQARAETQTAAVEMLNRYLDVAVMNAMNLGVGRLQRAMLEIRRELGRQDKEIVLLIEDFALIQGVQRDLLDAVIETGVRDGRAVLAPIRTLMAVTTGYYQRLVDTVLTRAKAATPYVYDLDVQFSDDQEGSAETTSFVGRYLNAARLGSDQLEPATANPAAEVPNACTDCDLRPDCHATFGASVQGHGLYPFNEPALRRSIHARAPQAKPRTFNPRAIIGEVVRNVLVEHAQALAGGTFPDASFRDQYPTAAIDTAVSSAVRRVIEDADPMDADRRALILEFWGDAPAIPTDLDPVLHQAFGLPLLRLKAGTPLAPEPASPRPAAPTAQSGAGDDLSPATRRHIDNVETWYTRGTPLHTDTALEIRSIVRDAVITRCQWNDPLMAEPTADVKGRAWPPKSTVVSIDDAGERLAGTDDAPIKFHRTSANSQFFQGLLRARAGKIPGSAEHLRRLAQIADQYQSALVRRVQATQGTTDEDLVVAMRASLLGAALAGHAHPGMEETQLLTAVIDEGQAWTRGDLTLRTPRWRQVAEAHQAARTELVANIRKAVGVQRGVTGTVRMIDSARAQPLLRAAVAGWTWPTPTMQPPDWVRKAVKGFADWDVLVDAQMEELGERLRRVRALLPKGTRGPETVQAVEGALDAALPVALGPRTDIEVHRNMIKEAAALRWKVVDQVEQDLERGTGDQPEPRRRLARITAAVRDRGPDFDTITTFLETSDTWLTEKLAEARMRENRVGDTVRDRVQEVLRQWTEITGEKAP